MLFIWSMDLWYIIDVKFTLLLRLLFLSSVILILKILLHRCNICLIDQLSWGWSILSTVQPLIRQITIKITTECPTLYHKTGAIEHEPNGLVSGTAIRTAIQIARTVGQVDARRNCELYSRHNLFKSTNSQLKQLKTCTFVALKTPPVGVSVQT